MVTAQRIDGVDISHHQNGTVDYAALKKAGVKWMFHKATEGATFVDSNYAKRRAEAKKAGLPFGAYHFARPDSATDAKLEAQFFIKTAKPVPGDIRPCLDLEVRDKIRGLALVKWADDFCSEVERLTGVVPIVYTPYELSRALETKAIFWRPRYNNTNTQPALPWDIWQFSNGVLGVPKSVPGLGNVDLNTSKVALSSLLIPKSATPVKPKKVAKLKFAHASLQFSDNSAQHTHDIELIFKRGYDVITGTEAGPGAGNTTDELIRCAAKYGYVLSHNKRYDTWTAVKKTLCVSSKTGAVHGIDRSSMQKPAPPGHWGDKGILFVEFNMGPTFGKFAVGAVHYVTNGGAGKTLKVKLDTQYAKVVADWIGAQPSSTVVFIGGDYNLQDRDNDWFRGQVPMLSQWDEQKYWPNTGYGCIDGFAVHKADVPRVNCVRAEAFDDGKLFLHTDHFLVEAVYEVTAL